MNAVMLAVVSRLAEEGRAHSRRHRGGREGDSQARTAARGQADPPQRAGSCLPYAGKTSDSDYLITNWIELAGYDPKVAWTPPKRHLWLIKAVH
jgi:hypothetical protein